MFHAQVTLSLWSSAWAQEIPGLTGLLLLRWPWHSTEAGCGAAREMRMLIMERETVVEICAGGSKAIALC